VTLIEMTGSLWKVLKMPGVKRQIEDGRLERISENKEVVAYMKVSWKNPETERVSQRRVVNPLLWRRWKRLGIGI